MELVYLRLISRTTRSCSRTSLQRGFSAFLLTVQKSSALGGGSQTQQGQRTRRGCSQKWQKATSCHRCPVLQTVALPLWQSTPVPDTINWWKTNRGSWCWRLVLAAPPLPHTITTEHRSASPLVLKPGGPDKGLRYCREKNKHVGMSTCNVTLHIHSLSSQPVCTQTSFPAIPRTRSQTSVCHQHLPARGHVEWQIRVQQPRDNRILATWFSPLH